MVVDDVVLCFFRKNKCKTKNKSEPRRQKFFIDGWLSEPVFKARLVKDKDNTWAQCSTFLKL